MADEQTNIGTQDAGAGPDTQTAEAAGNQGEQTSGADTQTATAEGQASQANDTTQQEGAEGVTEGAEGSADKGAHQQTLEERVQALAEKRVSELETKLTKQLEAATQAKAAEKPNFYEIDFDKVNEHIRNTMGQIEELELEGKMLEAMDLRDGLNQLRHELKGNEQRKEEWLKRENERTLTEQQNAQINQRIVEASDLVAREHNIPPDVWKAGEEFFMNERRAKPLIDAQYREKVMLQGPVAALLWAKEYVEKNMGKKEQELINKKEAAKTTLPPGKTSTGEVTGNVKLDSLREKAKSGNAEDLAAYMAEKSRAAATQ